MVYRSGCKRHRNRDGLLVAAAVGQQKNRCASAHKVNRLGTEIVDCCEQIASRIEYTVEHSQWQFVGQLMTTCSQGLNLSKRQIWRRERKPRQRRLLVQQARPGTKSRVQLNDDRFTQ